MDGKLEEHQIVDMSPLNKQIEDTTMKIIEEKDTERLKEFVNLFNINQAKKDVLRVDTYNKLIDSVIHQMELRITKKADEFSNKDLLDYLKIISESSEKSRNAFTRVSETPAIQINQVNIGDNSERGLSRESREKVMAAINAYMKKAMQSQEQDNEEIIIDNDGEDS